MRLQIETERLKLVPLLATAEHTAFIMELVNTEGWLRYIGDRNVHTLEQANEYVQRILDDPAVAYYVVNRNNDGTATGVVTFIKRAYLPYHDIGFAFMPSCTGCGYAYEAVSAFLQQACAGHEYVLATTLPDNVRSISLLKKLGLSYDREIAVEGEMLHLYSIALKHGR